MSRKSQCFLQRQVRNIKIKKSKKEKIYKYGNQKANLKR